MTPKQNVARSAVLRQARKKKTDPRHQCFSKYINKIIRQNEKNVAATADTLAVMNSIVNDVAKQIIQTATKLVQTNNKKTITDWEIEASTRMYFRSCEELKKDFTSIAQNHVRLYKKCDIASSAEMKPSTKSKTKRPSTVSPTLSVSPSGSG